MKSKKRKSPNRDARVRELRGMLRHPPKTFFVLLCAKAYDLATSAAVNDLRELGVRFTEEERDAVRAFERQMKSSRDEAARPREMYGREGGWEENLSFIAGFTSGGASYGTPWESNEVTDWRVNDLPF